MYMKYDVPVSDTACESYSIGDWDGWVGDASSSSHRNAFTKCQPVLAAWFFACHMVPPVASDFNSGARNGNLFSLAGWVYGRAKG